MPLRGCDRGRVAGRPVMQVSHSLVYVLVVLSACEGAAADKSNDDQTKKKLKIRREDREEPGCRESRQQAHRHKQR